jgi:hypothetical protein
MQNSKAQHVSKTIERGRNRVERERLCQEKLRVRVPYHESRPENFAGPVKTRTCSTLLRGPFSSNF